MEFLWSFPLGLAIGVLSAFFGLGGGFILTPIFLLLGFPATTAIATSLLYTISTSVSGSWLHFKMGNVNWKDALILALSGVIATQIAHPVLIWLDHLGHAEMIISILYLLLLAYFSITIFWSKNKRAVGKSKNHSFFKTAAIGLVGGFASSLLGVGGGFIMVPLLITLLGYESRKAVGTSLLSILFIVIAGFISYSFTTPINYTLALFLIIGAFSGTTIGAKMTKLYTNDKIKHLLGGLYIVTFLSVFSKLVFHLPIIGLMFVSLYTLFIFILFIIRIVQASHLHTGNAHLKD